MKTTYKYKKEYDNLDWRSKEYSISEDFSEEELINMEKEALSRSND